MIVYRITNTVNNKIYIGITTKSINIRWKEHCGQGFLLYKSIKKYGQDNFKVEVVDTATCEQELQAKEVEWISNDNSMSPYGYNLTSGGELNKVHCESTRRKMSEAKKGNKNPNFGTKTITKINPENGQVLHTISAPGDKCIGLTWDGNYLWTDDFETDLLYQINPEDGSVIYTVVSPNTNPRDLAWDGQYLWVVSAIAWTIYQVDVGYTTSVTENMSTNFSFGEITVSPNPFNKVTRLNYEVYTSTNVLVNIYNQNGKLITTLLNQFQNNGKHILSWDGSNSAGLQMPEGIYLCRFMSANSIQTEKIFLLR